MIARFDALLAQARQDQRAVGAFTCYTLEGTTGVLQAAETAETGVILLLSPQAFSRPYGPRLLAMLLCLADQARVPAAVQLDHTTDIGAVRRAFALGVQAVMADGSHLPLEDNVAFVSSASQVAHQHDGHLEVELAGLAGDEENAIAVTAGAMTDPYAAIHMVDRCQPACLAVAIGNVHGRYAETPRLDLPRLERIAASIDTPLALHGASGLQDDALAAAIARGISKVNINTELRQAVLDGMEESLPTIRPNLALLELTDAVVARVRAVAAAKLMILSAENVETH